MSQKPETVFRQKITRDLDRLIAAGLPLYYESIQQRSIKGSPDLMLCVNGYFIAMELKVGRNDLTALQKAKLVLICKANGMGWKVDPLSWPKFYELLEHLLKETRNDDNATGN